MKASQIIEQARSLADLQNSKAISYDDEKNSINTAYKLVYNKLSESDDDFYLLDYTFTDITQWAISMPFNFVCPLPKDFYKLRTVSYNYNGNWFPMNRMPLNMRNVNTSEPYYRIRNNDLWIVTGTQTQVGSVSIGYYPPPATITLPDYSTTFDISIGVFTNLADQNCISDGNTLYRTEDEAIMKYSQNQATPTLIYQGASAITYPVFYKGLIFFYEGTTLTFHNLSANTTSTIANNLSVVPFTVQDNIVYYTDGTDTLSFNFITSVTTTLFVGAQRSCVRKLSPTSYAYLEAGVYAIDNTIIDTDVTYLNYPYYNKVDAVYTSPTTIWKTNTQIGSSWNDRIIASSLLDSIVMTYSIVPDTDFSYPTNALFEILAYQSASDFKRKYDEASSDLDRKLAQLWDAFLSSIIRRDEYKTEKIQNVYNTGLSWGNF